MKRWLALLLATLPLTAGLHLAGLPAAFLMGPLAAAILLAASGLSLQVPRLPYLGAQGLLGCMIASVTVRHIPDSFRHGAPLLVAAVILPVLLAALLGYLLSRWRLLPATTGVWGTLPGAATAMVVMGEGYGADARLIAFMQYLRVLCVAVAASAVAYFVSGAKQGGAQIPLDWFPRLHPAAFAVALFIAFGGAAAGTRLRIPSGALLLPMVIAAAVHVSGIAPMQLPAWLLVGAYALLGWTIGLRFTRGLLRTVAGLLLPMLASIFVLIAFSGVLAWMLAASLHLDLLTAYLAVSPGGIDSAAIIAASTHADMPLIILLQTLRLVIVLALGPALARFAARRATLPE